MNFIDCVVMLDLKKTIVVHCKKNNYDVYIGRPSKWGNPFVVGRDGARNVVIMKYKRYLEQRPELIAAAKLELKGKRLGCWCSPLACHGDVLVVLVDGDDYENEALR